MPHSRCKTMCQKVLYVLTTTLIVVSCIPTKIFAEQAPQAINVGSTQFLNSTEEKKDLEIKKLKLEIEKLKKELSGENKPSNSADPPYVRPASMSEQEFIEIHRTYQDEQKNDENHKLVYPRSLIIRYKKLMEDMSAERSYSYLYARLLPLEEIDDSIKNLTKKFPDFSYGYRLLWHQKLYNTTPPDCKAALIAAERESVLDPAQNLKDYIIVIKQCISTKDIAPRIRLTYDSKSNKEDFYTSTNLSNYNHNTVTLKKRLVNTKKKTNISLEYVGMVQLNTGPGFHYKVTESGDYEYLRLLLIPKQEVQLSEKSKYISDTDFKTGNGSASIYISVQDMMNLKEIQIEI